MKRLACCVAVLATAGAVATVAIAAQPAESGFYGGTFKNKKGYVAFYAQKNGSILNASVQYSCKGKGTSLATPQSFKRVPISSTGKFVVKFKGDVLDENGDKIATGRARIVGRFNTPKHARGTARVRSRKCPRKKGGFTATGPQVEG